MALNRLAKAFMTNKRGSCISQNFDSFGNKCFENIKETLKCFQQKRLFPLLGIFVLICITGCNSTTTNEQNTVQPTLPSQPLESKTETPTITPSLVVSDVPTEFHLEPSLSAEDCNEKQLPEIACTGVTLASQWTPVVREFNGIEMMLVPAGCFQMGDDNTLPEESPAHTICFNKPFWLDRTEATVSQFADFLNGLTEPINNIENWLYKPLNLLSGLKEPNDQLVQHGTTWEPIGLYGQQAIGHVTWIGATDYCAWREARLPTEAEWEYSARSPESFIYPWGNEYVPENVVRRRLNNPDVGSKPQGASWIGALDLSGSRFEWTSSLYLPYPYDELDGREVSFEEDSNTFRVFRGSAWYHDIGVDDVSASPRFEGPLNYGYWYHGFRCARSLD